MPKKRKKKKPTHITISIELPEEDPYISSADVFINTFLQTLSYWIFGIFALALIGGCVGLIA